MFHQSLEEMVLTTAQELRSCEAPGKGTPVCQDHGVFFCLILVF